MTSAIPSMIGLNGNKIAETYVMKLSPKGQKRNGTLSYISYNLYVVA